MLILAYLRLFLDMVFKLCILALVEKPLENGLLNLLVILLLKELIVEKLHRAEHKKFSTTLTRIESTDGPVGWETDRTTWENRHGGTVHIKRRSIRIDKLKATVLIALYEVIRISSEFFCIFTSLLSGLFGLAFGDTHEVLIKNAVTNEALFRVQVLVEVLPDNWVTIDTDTDLLQEGINIGVDSAFTSLLHNYERAASALNVVPDVLQLMAREGQARPT